MDWLDNRNLYNAVEQAVDARRDFLPPLENLGPILRSHIEHSLKDEIRTARILLWRYADVRHKIITYHDPEKAYWREKARERMSESLRKKLAKPGKPERLKERQLILEQLIVDFRLGREKAVIDYLLEEASAISGTTTSSEHVSAFPSVSKTGDRPT